MNYTVLKKFSQFTIFEQLALSLKKTVSLKCFTVVNILFTFRIFNNFRMPWKQSFPWNFLLYWIYFLLFRIFEQRPLPWKNRVVQKFSTVLNILFTFRSFEQLAFALKNKGGPEFTVLNMYFLLFRIFEQLALALKTEFALKFFKPGEAAAPSDSPPRTPMHLLPASYAYAWLLVYVLVEKDRQMMTLPWSFYCFDLTKQVKSMLSTSWCWGASLRVEVIGQTKLPVAFRQKGHFYLSSSAFIRARSHFSALTCSSRASRADGDETIICFDISHLIIAAKTYHHFRYHC